MKEDIGKRGDRPVFIERPSDKEVNEGGEVTFECVISGLPDPEVTWYFNGRELYVSVRLSPLNLYDPIICHFNKGAERRLYF